MASFGGRSSMLVQHDSEARRLARKMWVQWLLLAAVIVVLIVFTAKYVW
jgi:hypothetical protein